MMMLVFSSGRLRSMEVGRRREGYVEGIAEEEEWGMEEK